MPDEVKMPTCEVCNKNTSIGICCIPGLPMSCAYCQECLEANAHPWGAIVANTACCGGLEHTGPEWVDMVHCTLKHLGRTIEEFIAEVSKDIDEMNAQGEVEPFNPEDPDGFGIIKP